MPIIQAEAPAPDPTKEMTFSELVRAYAVFTMCSFPTLVDNSPRLLQLATLPGLRWFGERFVRWTFFDQFVGGDTAEKTLPLLYKLRAVNKGALFAYSVEVDESEATGSTLSKKEPSPHKRIVEEIIHCVDVAANFEDGVSGKFHSGRRTWVAIKMSALIPDANVLVKFSSHLLNTRPKRSVVYPGCPHSSDLDILDKPPTGTLTAKDIAELRDFRSDLVRICELAQERGVKIIVDAEYSWYQPAIDALTLSLSRQFNKLPSRENQNTSAVQPLIYGTYQAYLRRTPELLAQSLADAKAGNYALGVKLVRGAYHSFEVAAHKAQFEGKPSHLLSSEPSPPVWLTKSETDDRYNACVRMLVRKIREDVDVQQRKGKDKRTGTPGLGVLFGTHNWESCDVILRELVKSRLAIKSGRNEELVMVPDDVTERVAIGQLYGMCDDLTNHLVNSTVSNTPLIIKYVPYGALSEVMPYLSRRAIENKSVLGEGAATVERRRAADEIKKRLFGSWYTGK
ncbi:hypothetical protein E4T56_gene13817 [Termitomyces sp. T112]|nr:hypothetical protein C0989_000390 [Termitomyces sp. Mn162]KAG5731851.1 hypothetical protein E4T56_gene13817 [Termitomyces sp. T112]